MAWKEFVKDYLHFTRRDRIAIFVILGLLLLIFFLPDMVSKKVNAKPVNIDTGWIASMKKLEQREKEDYNRQYADDNSNSYQYDLSLIHI